MAGKYAKKPIKAMSEEEFREYKAARAAASRETVQTEKKAVASTNFDSPTALGEKAAKALIVSEWGVTRPHLVDTVYRWGTKAAELNKLTDNHFYWSHGPAQLMASIQANERLPLVKDAGPIVVVGEVTYRKEIFALYTFMESWRAVRIGTFDEYLAERRSCKVDGTVNRGNKYFGKTFCNAPEGPHGKWDDMFLKWNPDGLAPDYSQESAKKWLGELSEDKKRLLIACRSSYKSTFSLCFLVAGILCCPDIRYLFCTETRTLSLEFLGSFVEFFEISNPNEPSRFNRLFPDFCVGEGESSTALKFQCPMSHLGLPQPTVKTTSMESGGWAGNRADYVLISDAISDQTVGTEEQIQKSIKKTDAISELVEIGGYIHWEGTPWHQDDLYSQLLARNERAEGKNLLYIIDPAWEVKAHAKEKDIWSLQEEDVTLLFPARLTWKVLQQKLREGDSAARGFRMQSLCMFLPEVENELKLQFDRGVLGYNIVSPSIVPTDGIVYASGDLGFSKSRYADPSAFTVFKVAGDKLYVLDMAVGRWKDSEKADKIIELTKRYSIVWWVIEKYSMYERLAEDIQSKALKENIAFNITWDPPKNAADRKFHAVKSLEIPISQGRIKFQAGSYVDDLFNELEKLDGTTPKKMNKSDDRADSLALGVRFFLPNANDEDAVERRQLEEEMQAKAELHANYQRIFESPTNWRNPPPPPAEKPYYNPIYSALDRIPNRSRPGQAPITFPTPNKH